MRKAPDERPEADALHGAAHAHPKAIARGGRSENGGVHGFGGLSLPFAQEQAQPHPAGTAPRLRRAFASRAPPRIHWSHASMPSPLVADTRSTWMDGLTRRAFASHRSASKSRKRQQVALVEEHEVGGGEHVRVLERLVLALGRGKHHHLVRLPQVEGGRADEVAHVLDHQHRVVGGREALHRVPDHVRVEVAALAGVHLHRPGARGADPVRVVGRLLVAFDHRDRQARRTGAGWSPRGAWSCRSRGWRRGSARGCPRDVKRRRLALASASFFARMSRSTATARSAPTPGACECDGPCPW